MFTSWDPSLQLCQHVFSQRWFEWSKRTFFKGSSFDRRISRKHVLFLIAVPQLISTVQHFNGLAWTPHGTPSGGIGRRRCWVAGCCRCSSWQPVSIFRGQVDVQLYHAVTVFVEVRWVFRVTSFPFSANFMFEICPRTKLPLCRWCFVFGDCWCCCCRCWWLVISDVMSVCCWRRRLTLGNETNRNN